MDTMTKVLLVAASVVGACGLMTLGGFLLLRWLMSGPMIGGAGISREEIDEDLREARENLKRAILLRASGVEDDGCVDPHNHVRSGHPHHHRRVMEAINELVGEGLVERDESRPGLFRTTGFHCITCVEAGRSEVHVDKCSCAWGGEEAGWDS